MKRAGHRAVSSCFYRIRLQDRHEFLTTARIVESDQCQCRVTPDYWLLILQELEERSMKFRRLIIGTHQPRNSKAKLSLSTSTQGNQLGIPASSIAISALDALLDLKQCMLDVTGILFVG